MKNQNESFKTRVKNVAITEAKFYKEIFIDNEYLICSAAFQEQKFYTINAKKENYMHLIGVNSALTAETFFEKCLDKSLVEDDFNFIKRNQSEGSVKGSVRRKISVLHNLMEMFLNNDGIYAEENFKKNKVICNLATSDGTYTIGFANTSKAYPKTLQKGNELNQQKSKEVDLVIKKSNEDEKFNAIIINSNNSILKYYEHIKHITDSKLICSIKETSILDEVAQTLE